ncbi:relaxin-3b isoform X1 [Oncorhynchus tshawytscha]|uniref:Relaxin-3 n=1 Tax=Oncorhynchus tshawytscha TaxID=74940 RepID=A0A8C8LYX6_ONCTS|nr:relaxin-3-like isoform X1 [Oncorhynchus mykiss]XP_021449709.1 relaxin-3 isoform X1 [Oncorhynchus mykiss]XP_024278556.2 relaxin-3b isoform X1 [Oncorhynchus tshawytscha]
MWKAAVLTFGLLVALVGMVQAAEGHANSIYGVKLCGREFIRAVIFTCGGSRWRRGVGDAGEMGDISIDEETEAYSPWSSNAIPGLASKQRPGLEAQGWAGEVREGGSAAAVFSRLARSPISEEVLEALRSADRKGRDVVVGLSNACCKWGCSKSEISSLC